jgi:hypothetical protein
MTGYRTFTYHYKTPSGEVHRHSHTIGEPLRVDNEAYLPDWMKLEYKQCTGCKWDKTGYCPVAMRLEKPAQLLGVLNSYEPIEVMVEAPERFYHKKTTAQDGLSALFGLIMATSECPAFASFKGLAWFHLPFATFEETLFRVLSSLLLTRYLNRMPPDEPALVAELNEIYGQIRKVNIGIAERLRKGVAEKTDSPLNAIVILDTFGQLVTMSVEDGMKGLKTIFGVKHTPAVPKKSPANPYAPPGGFKA